MAKKRWYHRVTIITILYITQSQAMIMRNNALMNKMVSHFQKDNYLLEEKKQKEPELMYENPTETSNPQKPEKVMSLMQNVLCRNFPAIPCKMIMEDETLRKLIGKSIQQIKYKTLSIDKTTSPPEYHLTLFPTINSEDLSNFLQVRHNNYYDKKMTVDEPYKSKRQKNTINYWSQEKTQKSSKKNKKDAKRTTVYNGRKQIRKFYPHKIKYKDKNLKGANGRKDFGDYSEEKLSMSVEVPDMAMTKRHQQMNFKVDQSDPPVWRIDYMKHGEPSLNMLGYQRDDRLKGKLVKTGPSVIVDENVLEHGARKDVLHPDVYIKKNYLRKSPLDINSEGAE